MTRSESELLLSGFFAKLGKTDFTLADGEKVKANIGEAILSFEFKEEEQTLTCEALIYRFRRYPSAQVLKEIERAAENEINNGGGHINFDSVTLNLSLVRQYSKNLEPTIFLSQMQELAAASLLWSSTILSSVADKISD